MHSDHDQPPQDQPPQDQPPRPPAGGDRPPWAPPPHGATPLSPPPEVDGGSDHVDQWPSAMHVDADDAEGPPPPPFVRQRRRRRNSVLLTIAFVVVGVPLVINVMSNGQPVDDDVTDDAFDAAPDGADDPDDRADDSDARDADGDPGVSESDVLDRPDPAQLDGIDATYARLLADIDASELTMIGFQDALAVAFGGPAVGDQDELTELVREAAGRGVRGLVDVRERLVDPLDDAGADAVRESYVRHLDSWVTYMEAVEDDPGILAVEDRRANYTVSINVTADIFARTLEEQLPDDAAADVRRFADGILDRGFRGFSESNV